MTHAAKDFQFTVTLHLEGDPRAVFTVDLLGRDDLEIRKKVEERHPGNKVLNVHCDLPRWRREFGHKIVSERTVFVGKTESFKGYECLEVETEFATVLVGPDDVYASISKTEREAVYWGIFASRKYGKLRGVGIMWLMTKHYQVGRRTRISANRSKYCRMSCGAEIYGHAATGVTSKMLGEQRVAEFLAKEAS